MRILILALTCIVGLNLQATDIPITADFKVLYADGIPILEDIPLIDGLVTMTFEETDKTPEGRIAILEEGDLSPYVRENYVHYLTMAEHLKDPLVRNILREKVINSKYFSEDILSIRFSYVFFDNPFNYLDCGGYWSDLTLSVQYAENKSEQMVKHSSNYCETKSVSIGVGEVEYEDDSGKSSAPISLIKASWGSMNSSKGPKHALKDLKSLIESI